MGQVHGEMGTTIERHAEDRWKRDREMDSKGRQIKEVAWLDTS